MARLVQYNTAGSWGGGEQLHHVTQQAFDPVPLKIEQYLNSETRPLQELACLPRLTVQEQHFITEDGRYSPKIMQVSFFQQPAIFMQLKPTCLFPVQRFLQFGYQVEYMELASHPVRLGSGSTALRSLCSIDVCITFMQNLQQLSPTPLHTATTCFLFLEASLTSMVQISLQISAALLVSVRIYLQREQLV